MWLFSLSDRLGERIGVFRLGVAVVRAGLLLCVACSGAVWAAQEPTNAKIPWKQFRAVKEEAEKLASEGNWEGALNRCEAFLREHLSDASANPGGFRLLTGTVHGLLQKGGDKEARAERALRLSREFRQLPEFAAMAAASYAGQLLHNKQTDPAAAEAFLRETLAALGGEAPPSFSGGMLLVHLGRALVRQGKTDAALKAAQSAPYCSPKALANSGFHKLLYEIAETQRDWDGMVRASKLAWVACAFDEKSVEEARQLVVQALTAKGGPGLARQFVEAQNRLDADNPLRAVELPVFPPLPLDPPGADGDTEFDLLDAAANDSVARVTAQLALGDCRAAFAEALELMRTAKTKERMVAARSTGSATMRVRIAAPRWSVRYTSPTTIAPAWAGLT